MWLGILGVPGHAPGTTRYFDDPDRRQAIVTADSWGLYCDRSSGPVPIILSSDDPNDPLNWPPWQRDLSGSRWTSAYIALLTGYYVLGVGVAGFFFAPSGRIWGKRHLFIIGLVILVASNAWAVAVGHNYTSLLWARITQGVGMAPFEGLVNAAVGDLYIVYINSAKTNDLHESGRFRRRFFTPVLVGNITHTIKWWWTFNLVSIFCGLSLVLVALFCPETSYRRDTSLNTDIIRKIFAQSLAPFDGRKTDESFLKLLFRPLPLFVQPAFLWAALIQGTMIGWTVFIGVILAAIFLGPPLFWDEVQTRHAYAGPFALTRLNGGIYEPEFHLVLVVPQLIFGVAGLFGFAVTAQGTLEGRFHLMSKSIEPKWVAPVVFFGFEVAGTVIGAVASSLYLVNAYRDLAIEGFTFGFTFKAYDWLVHSGIKDPGLLYSYIFGKRNRNFFRRHDLLEISGLR
ncbi:major facilitator superfamily transporter [Nemania serpens]|nr:major facilitator superfamily transporter [Nemania serpens]